MPQLQERPKVPRKPPPRRRPVAEPRLDLHTARIVGGVGVGGLLLVLIVVIALVAGSGGDGSDGAAGPVADTATPAATATATATPRAEPTPRALTAQQRETRDLAASILTDRGYEVTRLRDFDPTRSLQVLIGRSSSGNELAFFFVDGEYIGNDSNESSQALTVRRGGDDTSVVLRYAVASGDPVDVTFRWDGTRLAPESELPPASERG